MNEDRDAHPTFKIGIDFKHFFLEKETSFFLAFFLEHSADIDRQ